MKAYSYLRVSSEKQARADKDGVRRQKEGAEKYCREMGLELSTETFADLGLSGFKGENKDASSSLSRFLYGVDTGKIPTPAILILENLDRLSREDIFSALDLFKKILDRGITIVTLTDRRTYTKESLREGLNDILLAVLSFALANEESVKKQGRILERWEEKRQNIETKKIPTAAPATPPTE